MEKLTIKQHKHMTDEYDKVKYTCKNCGRRVIITSRQDRNLCDWCGRYVYRNKKEEFISRLGEKLYGRNLNRKRNNTK